MICNKCKSDKLTIVKSGPHNKLVCKECLSFQKFLSKKDADTFLKIKEQK
jgi:late competence protein required for DNA uptake (superfamily II DNA/RNA helicase)